MLINYHHIKITERCEGLSGFIAHSSLFVTVIYNLTETIEIAMFKERIVSFSLKLDILFSLWAGYFFIFNCRAVTVII